MQPSTGVPPARSSAQARLRALQSDLMELILDRGLEPRRRPSHRNELCLALGAGHH